MSTSLSDVALYINRPIGTVDHGKLTADGHAYCNYRTLKEEMIQDRLASCWHTRHSVVQEAAVRCSPNTAESKGVKIVISHARAAGC